MKAKSHISEDGIARLLAYKNAVCHLRTFGFDRIYSGNLADAMGVAATQVRKDFSRLGISGNKKAGYAAESLVADINALLGRKGVQQAVIVGAGSLGTALLHYRGFEREGIRIVAAFDLDPRKYLPEGRDPVYPIEGLRGFVRKHGVRFAVIAVPEGAAATVFQSLVEMGIVGVLNFAPVPIRSTDRVYVRNVNLVQELEGMIVGACHLSARGNGKG